MPGVQFSSTYQPANRTRTTATWLRERLSRAAKDGDKTQREAILEHLIEVATTWDVRVVGKGVDGELLKVASARDAVEAAKVLFAYDMGSPAKNPSLLELAEHLRAVEKDRVSTVIACLGSKLRSLSPTEMRDFFETCANDPEKFMSRAEQLLGGATEQHPEQAQLPDPEAKP